MKLLFLQNMNGVSGSELYLLQLLPELKKRGYVVEMLIVFHKKVNNEQFLKGLKLHGINTYEIYGHHALSPFLIYKINKLISKGNFDLIQSNLIHADLWTAIIKYLINPKIMLISVKHTYYPAYQAKYGYDFKYLKKDVYYWIERFTSRIAEYNITISKGLYHVFVDGGISRSNNTKNIYYGLTLNNPLKESINEFQEQHTDYVLITGRLVAFKGHGHLIRAWVFVHQSYPSLKLYIAGDGELRSNLEEQVRNAGLQNVVVFLGHILNPHPYMEKSKFTVVCSKWEGFGLILLESWLHKRPIVAFNAPAMNEVIEDGKNGLLVKMGDEKELAAKIIYLYERPQLIKEFGEKGYEKLNSYFTLKRMTDETEVVYKQVLDRGIVNQDV